MMFFVAVEKGDLWEECITMNFIAFYSIFSLSAQDRAQISRGEENCRSNLCVCARACASVFMELLKAYLLLDCVGGGCFCLFFLSGVVKKCIKACSWFLLI